MVDKCAGKVCDKDANGRERRCNPGMGRCTLVPQPQPQPRCPNGSRRDKNTGACHQTLSVFAQHLAQKPWTDVNDRLAGKLMLTSKDTKGHLDRIASRKRWSRRASEAILQPSVYRNANAVNAAIATGASPASIQEAMTRLIQPNAVDGDKYALRRLIHAGADVRLLSGDQIRLLVGVLPTSLGKIVFASGIDINTVPYWGGVVPQSLLMPVLHAVAQSMPTEIAEKVIVEFGADVNSYGGHNSTPLIQAVHVNRVDMVECLIEHGADVNLRSLEWSRSTPLMHAVIMHIHLEMVNTLLAAGARVNDRDDWGKTALSYARMPPHRPSLISAILDAGGVP